MQYYNIFYMKKNIIIHLTLETKKKLQVITDLIQITLKNIEN